MGQVLYSPYDIILHPGEIFEIQVKQLHTSFEFLPKDYFILHISPYNKNKPWRILEEFIYLNQANRFKITFLSSEMTIVNSNEIVAYVKLLTPEQALKFKINLGKQNIYIFKNIL